MKISIITPTYNSEKYLSETIASVLGQAGDFEVEYILVDGGSTDSTCDIIKKFISLASLGRYPIGSNSITMKLIEGRDTGMYNALNKGFVKTTGDILAYINSDDFYLPGTFHTISQIFSQNHKVDWLTGFSTIANMWGIVMKVSNAKFGYNKSLIKKGFYRNGVIYYIQQEGSFWRRSLWEKVGGKMNDSLKLAGDFELWTRFAKYADLWMVRASLAAFRKRPGQLSEQMNAYEQEIKSLQLPVPTWFEKTLLTKKYLQYFVKKIYSFPQLSYNKDLDRWVKSRKAA